MIRIFKKMIKEFVTRVRYPDAWIGHDVSVSRNTILGRKTKLLPGVKLGSCKVGNYTYVGDRSSFTYTEIGSFCSIGSEVICGLGKHPVSYVSTYPGFYSDQASGSTWFGTTHNFEEQSRTVIESDVWIGTRVTIIGGVKIGTGAVLAAGCVVTKDVPPYAIVAGVPAKIIRYRFDGDLIKQLLNSKWWERNEQDLKSLARYIDNPEEFLSHLKND